MEYSISISELIERPYLTKDRFPDYYNKMTNEEIYQYQIEMRNMCIAEGIPEKSPDMPVALMTKQIDREILYRIFKDTKI